jgi:hypothetical protein
LSGDVAKIKMNKEVKLQRVKTSFLHRGGLLFIRIQIHAGKDQRILSVLYAPVLIKISAPHFQG